MGFISKYLTWIKLAAVAALVAGAAYFAWDYRGALAEHEKNEAVTEAILDMEAQLNIERGMRQAYQNLAEGKLEALGEKLDTIKVTGSDIRAAIAIDVKEHPEFYSQPLPPRGYEQWMNARKLNAPPAMTPSTSPAPTKAASFAGR